MVLQFFQTAEGYVNYDPEFSKYRYVYNYTNHLGNIRASYAYDAAAANQLLILEQSQYYPFGLKHTNYNITVNKLRGDASEIAITSTNKYKFAAKEYQDELGLKTYDFGARNYDPALGRWMNMDPLAETSRKISPYTYALNNPMYFIDPDGMDEEEFGAGDDGEYDWVRRSNGSVYWDPTAKDQKSTKNGETYIGVEETYTNGRNGVTYALHADGKWDFLGRGVSRNVDGFDAESGGYTQDGLFVYGFGGDPIAGSGWMDNDRGKGAFDADLPSSADGIASEFMLIGNLAETFFKFAQATIFAIGESNKKQANWGNRPKKEAVEAAEKTSYRSQTTYSSGQVHTSGVKNGTKKEIEQDSLNLTKSKDGTGGKQTKTRIIRQ